MKCPQYTNPKPEHARVHPILREYFGYCLYKAALRLRIGLDDTLEAYGIIAPQFAILSVLDVSPPLSQADLGVEMGIDKTTMVKLLDDLERGELIRRVSDRKDRRIKRVEITSAGSRLVKRAVKNWKDAQDKFLSVLTPTERRVLREAIPKLVAP